MATSELSHPDALLRDRSTDTTVATGQLALARVLSALASLRLTVVLFALAIFLVFVATLAQKDHDVWEVVNDTYFRVWWARVDFLALERLAQMFFPSIDWNLTSGFYFPGGKLIGTALLLNLIAAHAVRFKVAASGVRLMTGLGVIAVGVMLTGLVIRNGMEQAIVSELSPAFYNTFWNAFRTSLLAISLPIAYIMIVRFGNRRSAAWWMLLGVDLAILALAAWFILNRSFRLDDAGLRILWQLVQGTAAGGVLLAGCVLVFRKRAGIVLLHAGVALLMFSELWVAMTAKESQMQIPEGATVNYSSDIRTSELALIDTTDAEHDRVTVVPESILESNVGSADCIENAELPVSIRVHRWIPNSRLREAKATDTNPATAGPGSQYVADEVAGYTGVGDDAAKSNLPSAYIELFNKDGKSLGTYLVSQFLNNQPIDVDGKKYDLGLRFKRIYHPWSLTLKDFRFDRYTGTDKAKNFSSLVELNDPAQHIKRDVPIWMNNPLRHGGTTVYQSSFDPETETTTILQVVSNPGWMTPYVACMLVAVGMLAHFGVMLVRFLQKRAVTPAASRAVPDSKRTSPWSLRAIWFPTATIAFFGLYALSKTHLPDSKPSEIQVHEFAKLPVAYEGRIKPYDTLARNTLQVLSGRQQVIGKQKPGWFAKLFGTKEKTPADIWLLETITGTEKSRDYQIFRIDNLDLLDALGLPRHDGFRYSFNDLKDKSKELEGQIAELRGVRPDDYNLYQRKVAELLTKINIYRSLVTSFQSPPISTVPEKLNESLEVTRQLIAQLRAGSSPHAVPPVDPTGQWLPLMTAEFQALLAQATNKPANPAPAVLNAMLLAYSKNDAASFNRELANYRTILANYERSLVADASKLKAAGVANAEVLRGSRVGFEVFYNHFSPFYYAAVLYVAAFVLGVLAWVGWTEPLRRASTWLLLLTFALHTLALVGRIYISGRPPVTNLYSAVIFAGWGGVLLAMAFEWTHKLGLGNIAAATIGFLSLVVANNLSLEGGDSFTVLQAVLDTQFWLATHVVTVNLGYGATFAAGLWGAIYILMAHVFPVLDDNARRQLLRVTYGTLCFAIFFSFVGTVLGGLWADDSWGRFWGWDPKENGALIIVLWNALVLHARWGGLVKNSGFATLAVGGNIAVAWSGFGVNEFGVGLHAYGASEGGTATWLLAFAISQLVVMALGAMPSEWFDKNNRTGAVPA